MKQFSVKGKSGASYIFTSIKIFSLQDVNHLFRGVYIRGRKFTFNSDTSVIAEQLYVVDKNHSAMTTGKSNGEVFLYHKGVDDSEETKIFLDLSSELPFESHWKRISPNCFSFLSKRKNLTGKRARVSFHFAEYFLCN